jgi:hypothetical protein
MDHYRDEEAGLCSKHNQSKSTASEYAEPHSQQPRTISNTKRILFVAAGLSLALVGFLAKDHVDTILPAKVTQALNIPSVQTWRHNRRSTAAQVCTTELCQTYASQIKANLAKNYTTIDPCDDMDMYACEGWRDTHDFRPEQNGMSLY